MKFLPKPGTALAHLRRSQIVARGLIPLFDRGMEAHRTMPRPKLFVLIVVWTMLVLVVWAYFAKIDMV
ncbi:HlyD family type I secretion periplasmic adaptor subunit, partial [Glaciimonas sp. Cout2]|nr:HlyD family type I secretion periplasmic adaptor subunit [Glaciimonas sp. Cout2]